MTEKLTNQPNKSKQVGYKKPKLQFFIQNGKKFENDMLSKQY